MIQSPQNNIIVTIESKFQDKIGNFFISTHFNPENFVTLVGTVVSLPRRITTERVDYVDFTLDGISVGDKILMRYDVVHSFKSQSQDDTTRYKNEAFYHEQSLWKCDIIKAFAVIKDDSFQMLNHYVMAEPFEAGSSLVLPHYLKSLGRVRRSKLLYINRKLGLKVTEGDDIFFDHKKVQSYRIGTNSFTIMRQNQILGHFPRKAVI
jgi:hypothetical protein